MVKSYNRKDKFYFQAKESGYRSRAAYKLIEIQNKSKILKQGDRVLDLGCFPGGWIQVASEIVGPKGLVIGIDKDPVEALPNENVRILQGDLCEINTINEIKSIVNKKNSNDPKTEDQNLDIVLSDMSPHLTGIKDRDDPACAELLSIAANVAKELLSKNGWFIAKIFPGKDCDEFLKQERKKWKEFQTVVLESTRGSSIEKYIIAKSKKL